MEQTIRERSNIYAEDKPKRWGIENKAAIAASYEDGALDEKKIIINKACELFEKELKQFQSLLNFVKNGAGNIVNIEGSTNGFRELLKNEE